MTTENAPDQATPDTIVLVHGLWVTPRSWEHWIEHYEGEGYRVLAPAYPGFEVEVEALNEDPSPIEALTIPGVVEHLGDLTLVVDELDVLLAADKGSPGAEEMHRGHGHAERHRLDAVGDGDDRG